jgi:hypothetical protein
MKSYQVTTIKEPNNPGYCGRCKEQLRRATTIGNAIYTDMGGYYTCEVAGVRSMHEIIFYKSSAFQELYTKLSTP